MPIFKKLIIISLIGILCFSCGKTDSSVAPELPEEEAAPLITEIVELAPVETPEYKQAMITFITGDVLRLENDEWIFAEIGDFLEEDDSIQVESDSYCEIQFGDKAVVRVEAGTELALSSVLMKPDETKIGIDLAVGSVLCKVQQLAGDAKFNVKTQSAVCGVRGTEFSVKSEPGEDTVLAVKEGAVAVLPPELDIEELIDKSGESGETVAAILENIELSASVVSANEEISLTEESFEEIKESVQKITKIVETIAAAEENEEIISEAAIEALTAAAGIVTETVEAEAIMVKELSPESIDKLKSIEEMRMISIPAVKVPVKEDTEKDTEGKTIEAEPIVSLHKFSLKVIPANAEILLNTKTVGKGSFSGIFEEGDILNFNIISENFQSQNMSFTISEETSKQYTISMEKSGIEPDKKEEEKPGPQAIEEKIPAVTEAASKDKVVEIKEEIKQQEVFVEEVSIEKKPVPLTPEPRPIESVVSISGNKLVGSITAGANMFFTSDSQGTVSAAAVDGRIVWSVKTENKSIENSYPVFIGNRIYFSGSSEFVIINAVNGKLISRQSLDKNSAHIFGRRVVSIGAEGLFPANEEIRVIDRSNGNTIRSISLPGNGSRMTPAVWNDKILSVDQNGVLSIINFGSGAVEKEISTGGSQPIALSITVKNDLAVFSGRKGNVVCIDLNAGKVLWEKQLNGSGSKVQVYSDIICSSTAAYIYTNGVIFGLNLKTGEDIFESINNVSSPPALIDNELVFGNTDARLIFMDAVSGNIKKSLILDNDVSTRPAELNGKICVGIYPGKMVIINPEDIR